MEDLLFRARTLPCIGHVGAGFVNLQHRAEGRSAPGWGRIVFHVTDVDSFYEHVLSLGLTASFPPRDAPWGERYFHLADPDGHELSFARPLG